MVVTYSFEDEADGSTRASVRVQGEPSAIYAIAGPGAVAAGSSVGLARPANPSASSAALIDVVRAIFR
jgi:hypothetical protein